MNSRFYDKAGNVIQTTIDGGNTGYGYNGDLMTSLGGQGLGWDDNGQLTGGPAASMDWNWDGKLRSGEYGTEKLSLKYDPMGNRVFKRVEDVTDPEIPVVLKNHKYIVDINGSLPVILCIVDGSDPNLLKSSYVYADAQPVCMRVHSQAAPTDPNLYEPHWYVHDRLGSVRQVVKLNESDRAEVENRYAYTPFGEDLAAITTETVVNPFKFTGQWYDEEIDQYHLRARMYDPAMMRFTARDPVKGKQYEPLTLHKYLYTVNNPINYIDPTGESMAAVLVEPITAGHSVHAFATSVVATGVSAMNWNIISFGIALEKTILPVMAVTVMARGHKPKDDLWKVLQGPENQFQWNMGNGGPWFPKGIGKWAAIATTIALLMDGCHDGIIDFFTIHEGKSNEQPAFEPRP